MSIQIEKKDYSTKNTLELLKNKNNYSFTLNKSISCLCIKEGELEKGDLITIINIDLKKDTDKKTHSVEYVIKKKNGNKVYKTMSGGIFLETFITQIEEQDIILKKIDNTKDKIKSKINETTKKEP